MAHYRIAAPSKDWLKDVELKRIMALNNTTVLRVTVAQGRNRDTLRLTSSHHGCKVCPVVFVFCFICCEGE